MPAFPIIDAHVHLWNPHRFRMPWLDTIDALNQPFGVDEFHAHTHGIDVAALVFVETGVAPAYALLEAQWAAAQAQHEPRLRGIVAAAPVEHGDGVRAYLEALAAIGPQVKGVRRLLQDEPDPHFCLQPAFVRGVQLLAAFNFSFDVCIRHEQLPGVVELIGQCPDVQFVLDHAGKPAIGAGEDDPWRAQMYALAALPNVVCKISGLVTEADHHRWTMADLQPYITHALDVFDEERVLFGGDWPVMLLASTYTRWVQTLDLVTAHLSETVQRKLWVENARHVYRLDEGDTWNFPARTDTLNK